MTDIFIENNDEKNVSVCEESEPVEPIPDAPAVWKRWGELRIYEYYFGAETEIIIRNKTERFPTQLPDHSFDSTQTSRSTMENR